MNHKAKIFTALFLLMRSADVYSILLKGIEISVDNHLRCIQTKNASSFQPAISFWSRNWGTALYISIQSQAVDGLPLRDLEILHLIPLLCYELLLMSEDWPLNYMLPCNSALKRQGEYTLKGILQWEQRENRLECHCR